MAISSPRTRGSRSSLVPGVDPPRALEPQRRSGPLLDLDVEHEGDVISEVEAVEQGACDVRTALDQRRPTGTGLPFDVAQLVHLVRRLPAEELGEVAAVFG